MWLKKLRKRKLQSVLIILIIMVCSVLMTSSLVIMTSWEKPYDNLIDECRSPAFKLSLFDASKVNGTVIQDKLEQLKEVDEAQIIEYRNLHEKVSTKNEDIEVFFDMVVYNETAHGTIRMLEGARRPLNDNECLIPAVLANEKNIKVGDVLKVGDNHDYTVKGIYTDPYNMSISFRVEMLVNALPTEGQSNYYLSIFSNEKMTGSDLIDVYRENNDTLLE